MVSLDYFQQNYFASAIRFVENYIYRTLKRFALNKLTSEKISFMYRYN